MKTALIIVDMQKYYLQSDSAFHQYFSQLHPGCMDYITQRCQYLVVPNIQQLIVSCRLHKIPILYLRLCGEKEDRSDLQPSFRDAHQKAFKQGTMGLYPLVNEPMADIAEAIIPEKGEVIINKTTFSAFTSSNIELELRHREIGRLLFTGLATSQCVDTTARDAADRSFEVIHIADAQADYSENVHMASLYASAGVCGGQIINTDEALMAISNNNWVFEK